MDLDALADDLSRAVPDLRPLGPLRLLDTGFGSVAVETRGGVIFRIARHPRAAEGHEREWRLLPLLSSRLPVRIPEPRWRIPRDTPGFPLGAIGYEKLPGVALTPDPMRERSLAEQVAAVIRRLHDVPLEEVSAAGLPGPDDWHAAHEDVLARAVPALKGFLSPDELAAVEAWAERFLSDGALGSFEPTLVHGDLWYGNLLRDPSGGEIVGLVDWENAAVGDPAQDLATQFHLGQAFGNRVVDECAAGRLPEGLRHRVRRLWEFREFTGIALSLDADDPEELRESVEKLRRSPVLSGRTS